MSRRKRNSYNTQQRAAVPPGSRERAITAFDHVQVSGAMPGTTGNAAIVTNGAYPGMNVSGINTMPASAYQEAVAPGTGAIAYPPGDPIRPIPGLDDGMGGPRGFAFPVGINIVPTPRATEDISFTTLRNLAASYEGVQLCQAVILRVLQRTELQIVPRPELVAPDEDVSAEKWTRPARQMADWFAEPDHRGTDLDSWMVAVMRDLLELDAVGVFHRPTKGGGLYGLEYVAGDTIACLHDLGGRSPLPPAPAYQQVVYGVPAKLLTREQLDYHRMTTRTDSLYGRGPVERILLRINLALRKEHYDLVRYTDGATPEGVIQTQMSELSRPGAMTPQQVQEWEKQFNALLAGNSAMRVRTKFIPPGFTFTSTQQPAIATELDDYLLHVTVAMHGLTMDELGFTDTSNRSTGQTQENVVYRNAIKPTADYFGKYFSRRVIARYDGLPLSATNRSLSVPGSPTKGAGVWDARFRAQFGGIEEPEDFVAKSQAYGALADRGVLGRTEVKRLLKIPLKPGEEEVPPMITVQGGAQSLVIVEDLLKQRDQMHEATTAQLAAQTAGAQQTAHAFATGQMPVQAQGHLQQQKDQQDQAQENPEQPQSGAQPAQQQPKGEQDNGESGSTTGGGRDIRRPVAGAGGAGGREPRGQRSDSGGNTRSAALPAASASLTGGSVGGQRGGIGGRYSAERLLDVGGGGERGSARGGSRSVGGIRGVESAEEGQEVAVADEWKRYRERAVRFMKDGRWPMPPFVSDVLPAALHAQVAAQLVGAETADEVRAIFAEARRREADVASTDEATPDTEAREQDRADVAAEDAGSVPVPLGSADASTSATPALDAARMEALFVSEVRSALADVRTALAAVGM